MRKAISAMLAIGFAACFMQARAEVTVMAVRIGADDIVALAKFYETAFGLKEIDRVGNPVSEIIMRYGATVEEAKAGSSPEFLLQTREAGAARDPMIHAIFRVSDLAASVEAAKAAGATMDRDVATVAIGGTPIKIAFLVDPDGNSIELMELPANLKALPH